MTENDIGTARLLPWWDRWPGLLDEELGQFAHRGLHAALLADPRQGDGRLVIETSLDLRGHGPVQLKVVYPDGFPDRRFAIYAAELRLGRHQAFGGNLCVMPRESAHWDPWFKAADIIVDRVPHLVALVEAGGDALRQAEDPQGEPLTSYYDSPIQGGIIFDDRSLVESIAAAGSGTLELRDATEDAAWLSPPPEPVPENWALRTGLAYLAEVRAQSGDLLTEELSDRIAALFPVSRSGRWTFVPNPPYATSADELWDHLVASDAQVSTWSNRATGLLVLGMCTREEVRQGEFELTWVFLARRVDEVDQSKGRAGRRRSGHPGRQHVRRTHEPVFVRGLRRTEDALAARIPELRPLRDKTAAVIGLGSLGAPLVQELVKSRVQRLRLVDYDQVDPATTVRYPLGLADAGVNKALALAKWGHQNHPEVEISIDALQIGATPLDGTGMTELETLARLLTGTDLMISATAEHDVNRQLDTLARELGVPRLYLWSQSGFGGVVALLRAGKTGCYHCLELLLSESAQAGEPFVRVPPDGPHGVPAGTIQSPGCADKTFTAPHADLMPIAMQATRVAFGSLCSAEDGYPTMVGDVFSVQVREPDGTPIPARWTITDLEVNPACPNCNAF